jgi:hypothetical protein
MTDKAPPAGFTRGGTVVPDSSTTLREAREAIVAVHEGRVNKMWGNTAYPGRMWVGSEPPSKEQMAEDVARPQPGTQSCFTVVPKFYSRPSDVGPDSYAETVKKMYEECERRTEEQRIEAPLAFVVSKQPYKIAFLDGVVLCFFSAIIGAMLMHWFVQ